MMQAGQMICHTKNNVVLSLYMHTNLALLYRVHSLLMEPAACLHCARAVAEMINGGTVYPGWGPSVRWTEGPIGLYILGYTVQGDLFSRIGSPGGPPDGGGP